MSGTIRALTHVLADSVSESGPAGNPFRLDHHGAAQIIEGPAGLRIHLADYDDGELMTARLNDAYRLGRRSVGEV
ncbi:MAG TPA: hypothetical protein VFY29_11895 [Terriglobia bacterium]|nr:hypothetical protein [Terriglobia bacterium]